MCMTDPWAIHYRYRDCSAGEGVRPSPISDVAARAGVSTATVPRGTERVASVSTAASVAKLAGRGTAYIAVDRPSPGRTVMFVLVDTGLAARQATAHLVAQGYERIGYVTGPAWGEFLPDSGARSSPTCPVTSAGRAHGRTCQEGSQSIGRMVCGPPPLTNTGSQTPAPLS